MASVQFKFRSDSTSDDRQRLLSRLEDSGADRVERLFPDAPDDELAAFYSALVNDRQFSKLLSLLKRAKAIEFAEPQPERRLILPVDHPAANGSKPRKTAQG